MRVSEAMSRDVQVIHADRDLFEAARMMADCDCGSLPVEDNDRLVGMLTDRDIVIRALAEGKSADSRIRDVMSPEVKYCFEDDDLDSVAQNMGDLQVRRLPVVTRDKRLVGILSLGDIANADEMPAGDALAAISEPSTQHMSTGQRPH